MIPSRYSQRNLMDFTKDILKKKSLKHSDSVTRSQRRWLNNGIYSVKEFRAVVERERARADRNGGEFSLVVFDMGEGDKNQNVERRLIELISNRIRSTDEVGWIDTWRIGVNLPDTSAAGARNLARCITQEFAVRRSQLTFKIYTYPVEWVFIYKWLAKPDRDYPNHRLTKGDPMTRNASIKPSDKAKTQQYKSLADGFNPLLVRRTPIWKRIIDILGSGFGLIFLSPILLIIAAVIKIVSPGPVLFKQIRVGYLGKQFILLKFRTMKFNADTSVHVKHVCQLIKNGQPLAKLDDSDPRIIPFGKFLRLTGLDELPQLINILKGEMSLIGPRPELLSSMLHCERWHTMRLNTKPGLSGLWQVSNRTDRTFDEMMRLDVSYVKQMSFWLDVMILLKTVPTIVAETIR